jgi:hypothetical protein
LGLGQGFDREDEKRLLRERREREREESEIRETEKLGWEWELKFMNRGKEGQRGSLFFIL